MTKDELDFRLRKNKEEIKRLREENKNLEAMRKQIIENTRTEKSYKKLDKIAERLELVIKSLKYQDILENANKLLEEIDNVHLDDSVDKAIEETSQSLMYEDYVKKTALEIVNNPNTEWYGDFPKYRQARTTFVCPDCGEQLFVRHFKDSGKILLTCYSGFKKNGCTFGWKVN